MNKIDAISIEELDLLYRIPNSVPISAKDWLNIDEWVPFPNPPTVDRCASLRGLTGTCIGRRLCDDLASPVSSR